MPDHTRHSGTGHTPGKALLTAWLLVLLRDGEERHGWGLVSELRHRGIGVEPGLAYRILRALEAAGAVSSQWAASSNGPRRRSYRITRVGRDRLDELAANAKATWVLHDAFLQIYEHPVEESGEASEGVSEVPDAPARDLPAQSQSSRELLAAWRLLLIARHASYGYSLRAARST